MPNATPTPATSTRGRRADDSRQVAERQTLALHPSQVKALDAYAATVRLDRGACLRVAIERYLAATREGLDLAKDEVPQPPVPQLDGGPKDQPVMVPVVLSPALRKLLTKALRGTGYPNVVTVARYALGWLARTA